MSKQKALNRIITLKDKISGLWQMIPTQGTDCQEMLRTLAILEKKIQDGSIKIIK